MMMIITFLFAMGLGTWAQSFKVPDTEGMSWHKGNTHAHSRRRVGASSPQGVATWYRNNGYQFLVLTDDVYPPDPLFISKVSGSGFLLMPGMEIKAKSGPNWVHVNGLNASTVIRPEDGPTLLRTLQRSVDAVREAGGIPQIDHPRYMDGPDVNAILASQGFSLMEIYNGQVGPVVAGENGYLSTETDWDWLPTKGKRVFGVAADDTKVQPGTCEAASARPGQPGRGWVVVRARELDAVEICRSLERGTFYASTGVDLADVSIEQRRFSITIKPLDTMTYTTTFIGDCGRVLLSTPQNPAFFDLAEKLTYVRAKVTDSAGNAAWIQPAFVQ